VIALLAALVLAAAPVPLDQEKVDELKAYVLVLRPESQRSTRLARIALDVAQRQGLDPKLLLAIARVESNLEPEIVACWPDLKRPGERTCDHGLMQINDLWTREWGINPDQLRLDTYLNVWTAARILVRLQKEFGTEPNWYSRYHSNVPWRRAKWEKNLHQYWQPPEA
jgi:soluble lytic murein transglycosylase-like protein